MRKRIFVIAAVAFIYTVGIAQHSQMDDKIDPAFTALIAKEKVKNTATLKKCNRKTNIKKSEYAVSKNGLEEKKYDCIVYTKKAEVLKNAGIIVNSTLPTFVTVSATLRQIKQMAAMPEVVYIKAPKMNYKNERKSKSY